MKNIGFGKRLLTMLLVVTMLLSIVPVEVFSDDGDFATTGESGLVGDISNQFFDFILLLFYIFC